MADMDAASLGSGDADAAQGPPTPGGASDSGAGMASAVQGGTEDNHSEGGPGADSGNPPPGDAGTAPGGSGDGDTASAADNSSASPSDPQDPDAGSGTPAAPPAAAAPTPPPLHPAKSAKPHPAVQAEAAPTWISSPILGHRYGQKVVSASPFASAKTALAPTESVRTPFNMTEPTSGGSQQATGGGSQYFTRRMTYPLALTNGKSFIEGGFGVIRDPNCVQRAMPGSEAVNTAKHSAEALSQSTQPNPYWENPPPTLPPQHDTRAKDKLPRDLLHPLVSSLQAAENSKAATFNPNLKVIASPNRQNTPAHCRPPGVGKGGGAAAGAGFDTSGEGAAMQANLGVAHHLVGGSPLVQPSVPEVGGGTLQNSFGASVLSATQFGFNSGLCRSAPAHVDKRDAGVGARSGGVQTGIFSKDAYAPTVVANMRSTSLTGMAARALCTAIHGDAPPNSIPANAAATAHISTQRPNDNRPPRFGKTIDAYESQRVSCAPPSRGEGTRGAGSGPQGSTEASPGGGKARGAGGGSGRGGGGSHTKTPVVPPSQAYRLLSKELQGILRARGAFTRSKVAAYLFKTQCFARPPPEGVEEETEDVPPPAGGAKGGGRDEGGVDGGNASGEEGEEEEGVSGGGAPRKGSSESDAGVAGQGAGGPMRQVPVPVAENPDGDLVFVGVRNDANTDDPILEDDDDMSDPSMVYGLANTTLSLWNQSVAHGSLAPNPGGDVANAAHAVRQATCGAPLNILTPELVTAFNVASNEADFVTFFASQGLRMGDCMAQVRPLSPSASNQQFTGGGGGGGGGTGRGFNFNETTNTLNSTGGVPNFMQKGGTGGGGLGDIDPALRESNAMMSGGAAKGLLAKKRAPSAAFSYDNYRFLALLTEKGTEVEQIYFEGMQWLSMEVTSRIGDFCPQLRLLNLSRCDSLTDGALITIATKCHLLSYVNISNCLSVSAAGVQAVVSNATHLSVLCCHSIKDIDPLGETFALLHLCRGLKVLDISYCEDISDLSLVNIAKYCPGLSLLDISGCHKVGDVGLRSIGGRCSHLHVWKCKLLCQGTVTSAGIAMMTQAPRNLKELDLSGVTQVDDEALSAILNHAKSLIKLSVAGCVHITDKSLAVVNSHCKQLRVLNLSACKRLTLNSCMDLIYDIRSLRCLVVSGSSISEAEVSILQSLRDDCKVVLNDFRPRPVTQIWTLAQSRKPSGGAGKKGKKK